MSKTLKIHKKVNNSNQASQIELKTIRLISQSEEDYKAVNLKFKIFLKNGSVINIDASEDTLNIVSSNKESKTITFKELLDMVYQQKQPC